MHYLSLAALTAASLLSRHFVLTESQDLDKDTPSTKASSASVSPPTTQLPLIINFSPEYALKFAREFRYVTGFMFLLLNVALIIPNIQIVLFVDLLE